MPTDELIPNLPDGPVEPSDAFRQRLRSNPGTPARPNGGTYERGTGPRSHSSHAPTARRGLLVGMLSFAIVAGWGLATALIESRSAPDRPVTDTRPLASPTAVPSVTASTTTSQPEVEEYLETSWIDEFAGRYGQIVGRGQVLASASIETVAFDGGTVSVTMIFEETLWSPAGDRAPFDGEFVATARGVPASGVDDFRTLAEMLPIQAVALVDPADLQLVALGILADSRNFVRFESDTTRSPLFLWRVGEALLSSQYVPGSVSDPCQPASEVYSDEVAAIPQFLEALSVEGALEVRESVALQASQITENAPMMIDPVSRSSVTPAVNDVIRQLSAGVPAESVVIRGSLPVMVVFPEKNLGDAAVFIGQESNAILGFLMRDPSSVGGVDQDMNGRAVSIAEIAPPVDGEAIEVYIRSVDERLTCAPGESEPPFATIAGEAAGPELRAVIDLETGDVQLVKSLQPNG